MSFIAFEARTALSKPSTMSRSTPWTSVMNMLDSEAP